MIKWNTNFRADQPNIPLDFNDFQAPLDTEPGTHPIEHFEKTPIPRLIKADLLPLNHPDLHKFINYVRDSQIMAYERGFKSKARGIANIETWSRDHRSGVPLESLIKKFTHIKVQSKKTDQQTREQALILYPLFSNARPGKLDFHITLVMEFKDSSQTAQVQIEELRALNESKLNEYFRECGKLNREIEPNYENQPGIILNQGNLKIVPNYRALSFEQMVLSEIKNRLIENKVEASYDLSLFEKDLIYIGRSNMSLKELKKVDENGRFNGKGLGLYLPLDPLGEFAHNEIRYVYRVLADAFEQHIRFYAKYWHESGKYTQLLASIQQYDLENPPVKGNLQNKNRIRGLIELIESHFKKFDPNMELVKNTFETFENIEVLKSLLAELDREAEKKAEKYITEKYQILKSKIMANSQVTRSKLTIIDPEEIFSEAEITSSKIFNSPENIWRHSQTVIKRLQHDAELCSCQLEEKETGRFYFGHLAYLAKIEGDVKKRKEKTQILAVEKIIRNLPNTHPGTSHYKTKLQEMNPQLAQEASNNLKEYQDYQKKEQEKQKRKNSFNLPVAALGGFIAGFLSFVGSFLFLPLSGSFAIGIIIFLSAGFVMGRYFSPHQTALREEEKYSEIKNLANTIAAYEKKSDSVSAEKNLANQINQAVSEFLFPKSFESIIEKVHTDKTLQDNLLANLDVIRRKVPKLSKAGDDKVISSVKAALQGNLVIISIKNPPKGIPAHLYINPSDFRSPILRTAMAEYFRKEKENTPATQIEKHRAYDYIIDQIERNYPKYLNRARLNR